MRSKLPFFLACTVLFAGGMSSASVRAEEPDILIKPPACQSCVGFYWHDKEKEEEKPKEIEPKEEPKAAKKETPKEEFKLPDPMIPPALAYTDAAMLKMHPKQVQYLVTAYLDKAVMEPSPLNVHDYYRVQNVARVKANAYASVADYVTQTDQGLSMNSAMPLAMAGRTAIAQSQTDDIEGAIRSARDDFALLYFYSPQCKFCAAQSEVNNVFYIQYGWQPRVVDVNLSPGLAEKFGIKTTPTLLLVYRHGAKDKDWMPVAVGVVSADEMAVRIYRAMRLLRGDITPEQWSLYEFQRGGVMDPGAAAGDGPGASDANFAANRGGRK